MTGTRLLVAGATAVVAAVALLLGGLSARDVSRGESPGHVSTGQLAAGFAAGDTQALLLRLQDGLRTHPASGRGLDLLGLAYQQRARETGDPAYYTKSDGVLRRALRLAPDDLLATSGLGSLALSRHRFPPAERGPCRSSPAPLRPPRTSLPARRFRSAGRARERRTGRWHSPHRYRACVALPPSPSATSDRGRAGHDRTPVLPRDQAPGSAGNQLCAEVA